MDYKGVIIEESLEDKKILDRVKIISTEVEKVTEKHRTPWLKKWTLHMIGISEDKAMETAEKIAISLDRKHPWYADYKNQDYHFIIFKKKIFVVDRTKKEEYEEAKKYGIRLGIPEYQVYFGSGIDV